jgi:DNA-binding response OmpR family regulator
VTDMGTNYKQTQQPTKHAPNRPLLLSLLVLTEVDNTLHLLFEKCGYQATMTTFNNIDRHMVIAPYDMLLVEIGMDKARGFDLISPFQANNPGANVLTMTKDNQKDVERRARSLKVDYHLISPYSTKEIFSILTHLAVRQTNARRKGDENPRVTQYGS